MIGIKWIKFFVFLLFINFISCKNDNFSLKEMLSNMDNDHSYIIYRGANSKESFYARKYNIYDTLSSHIGLLVNIENSWKVYHILSNENENLLTDIRNENFLDFVNSEKEDIYFISIWELNNKINYSEKIKKTLVSYSDSLIKFDETITIGNRKSKYCSEFIRDVLYNVDSIYFKIETRKIKLNGLDKYYMKRDTLVYYPVDAFQFNENITKSFEIRFE